jgi:hypothetical protein
MRESAWACEDVVHPAAPTQILPAAIALAFHHILSPPAANSSILLCEYGTSMSSIGERSSITYGIVSSFWNIPIPWRIMQVPQADLCTSHTVNEYSPGIAARLMTEMLH